MKNTIRLSALIVFILSLNLFADTEIYVADPAHSSVEFKISHFFSKVTGRFTKFSATITVDRTAIPSSIIKAEIDVASVDTAQPARDKHLQSPDFFNAAKFPKMTFVSTSWSATGEKEFDVTGDLTLHGVTKPIILHVTSLGFGRGMKDVEISGWSAKGTIKRSEFGMTTGGPAVGDDVDIEINVEAKKES